jgi:SAM-dependent methyltransferase
MHINSLELFLKYTIPLVSNLKKENLNILEIGPDRQLNSKRNLDSHIGENDYTYWYSDINKEYMKKIIDNHWNMCTSTINDPDFSKFIEINNDNKFVCDDNKFDVCFALNVIEHVKFPWIWLNEIKRITKPNGYIIIVCPGITTPYHKSPIDCWRIWPDGFEALYEYTGIKMIHSSAESLVCETDGLLHSDTIAIGTKI